MSLRKSPQLWKKASLLSVLAIGAWPLAAQSQSQQTEQQFIDSVTTAVSQMEATLTPPPTQPIIFGSNIVAAYGTKLVGTGPVYLQGVLNYIDGLKAAGVQRVEFNPGVDSMFHPGVVAQYDAIVQHVRDLGLQLAINPEYEKGETKFTQDAQGNWNDTGNPFNSFAEFQTQQLINYQILATRYQPDNFVLVHEPDTMTGRLEFASNNFTTTFADWRNFILAAAPIVKAASPFTLVAAGCAYNPIENDASNEDKHFQDFANNIPACPVDGNACLDLMTMDIYSTAFDVFAGWAELAHQTGKGVYIEETWAPPYVPNPLPQGTGESLDQLSIIGPADVSFENLDQTWLQAVVEFASYYGMTSVTPFTTETFFTYGLSSQGTDKPSDSSYWDLVNAAIANGQLTTTAQTYLSLEQQYGIPEAVTLNSASYATLPTVFDPSCGTATNPCNPLSVVAPASLASAFGADLANATAGDGTFPTTLAGTTATLLDSTNTLYQVPMYLASPNQVNYFVPAEVVPGPATLKVYSADGTVSTGFIDVQPAAPGLYTASQNGQGVAAGIVVCAGTCSNWPNPIGNGQFYQYTFTSASGTPQPVPIAIAAGDTVVVELYGTGIRGISSATAITATAVGQNLPQAVNLPIYSAGAQNQYMGLDQVNVVLPPSLSGAGLISITLTVNDPVTNINTTFNPVTLDIQ